MAVLCDRLFLRAAWVPLSVLQDRKLAAAARLGIYELGHLPGSPHRPVLVTSISERPETLTSIMSELSSSYGLSIPGDPRGQFLVIPPGDLASEPARSLLADPAGVVAEIHDQVAGLLSGPFPVGCKVSPRTLMRRVAWSITGRT
jgi:hypothetical protein